MHARRCALILLAACVPLFGHDARASRKATTAEPSAKPQAPVTVQATIGAKGAVLAFKFASAARNVDITVYGRNGLAVEAPGLVLRGGTFAANAATQLSVAFGSPTTRGDLVVNVRGLFNNAPQSRAVSFSIGADRRVLGSTDISLLPAADGSGKVYELMPSSK